MITLQQLQTFVPTNSRILQNYVTPINNTLLYYNINTLYRRSAFISQIAYESQYFRYNEENLNYSAERLLQVFPKYFDEDSAQKYAYHGEMIANRIYANRLGNGNEASGDGYKYDGKGLIQITGKYNYSQYANYLKKSLDDTCIYLKTYDGSVNVAGWFWNSRNLNSFADLEDIVVITKIINGSYNGLQDRQILYAKAKQIFLT